MKSLRIEKRVTSRDSEALQKYLKELNSNSKPISKQEEIELAARVKAGDLIAKEKMVKANLRFVVSVAKQYQGQSNVPLEDLISEGNIGLLKAVEKYDETQGHKFISYAVWWIRQAVMSAITDNSNFMRIPSNKVSQYRKIREVKDLLSSKFNREPSTEEIIEHMMSIRTNKTRETTEEDVENAFSNIVNPKSLDSNINSSEEGTLMDIIPNENAQSSDHMFENSDNEYMIKLAISSLNEREKHIISMLYGLHGNSPMTLDDVSEEVGLTRERIRQIKDTSLRLMRNHIFKKSNKKVYNYVSK